MDTRMQLEEIIREAREALTFASAGGEIERIFDLVVDSSELSDAYDKLFELNGRIANEIADQST